MRFAQIICQRIYGALDKAYQSVTFMRYRILESLDWIAGDGEHRKRPLVFCCILGMTDEKKASADFHLGEPNATGASISR